MAILRYGERHPIGQRHMEMLEELVKLQAEASPDFAARAMFESVSRFFLQTQSYS